MLHHQSEADYREPLFTLFTPPPLERYLDGRYAIYICSWAYWLKLLTLLSLQVFVASLIAFILYKVVIKPRAYDSAASLLLVYGAILPFWMALPVHIIQFFDIRNLVFKFVIGVITPTLSIFRATEAVHGFSPEPATRSAMDFVVYYSSILVFSRDQKGNYIRCPWKKVATYGFSFLQHLVILGLLKSIMIRHENMIVFGPQLKTRSEWYSAERFATWELYANNAVQALLFQLYLTAYCEGLSLLWTGLSGYQVETVMRNPILEAQSPTDFWSRRWNLLIHRVLKGGVYKPIRKYNSAVTACVAVFVASGAFHEWVLSVTFLPVPKQLNEYGACIDCFVPAYGYTMAFFLWQSCLIIAEIVIGRNQLFQTLGKNLPTPLRTFLVICLGLPFAHLFMEPYARSEFFYHGQPGVPMVRWISNND